MTIQETIKKAIEGGFGNRLKEMFELSNKGLCPFCSKKPVEFRDEKSRAEFEISGICQNCQDDFFGK